MHQSGGKAGKVGHIIEEKFSCLVHLLVIATLSDLDDLGVVWTRDELFEVSEAIRLGKGKDELRLDEGLTCLLASHLEVANQILKVT